MSSTLVPHSSSHDLESLDDELQILESVDPFILDMTRKTLVKAESLTPASFMSEELKALFQSNPSFNWRSVITADSPEMAKLGEYCGTDGVYTVHLPGEDHRLWHMPQEGWQAIPFIFFELGFRLPMHPVFAVLFKLLGCGIAQLSPNAVVQICGVIARSHDKGKIPTVDLLLSLYRVKYGSGQLYLDKKPGCTCLVDVRSSNNGWHGKCAYFAGGELGSVGPWSDVSKNWLHELNHLSGLLDSVLDLFREKKGEFSTEDFTKHDFLVSRCCKILFLYCCLFLFFCCLICLHLLCWQWLGNRFECC